MMTVLTTKDVGRRDLLRMTALDENLSNHDLLLLCNRSQLDAVLIRPQRLIDMITHNGDDLVSLLKGRLYRDTLPTVSGKDISILLSLSERDDVRLTDIADSIGQPLSNIHANLQKLVDLEMVERREGDDITYYITNIGREFISESQ